MEWKRMKWKTKEGGQGMEVIEKARWEGDKTVEVESENRDEERNG